MLGKIHPIDELYSAWLPLCIHCCNFRVYTIGISKILLCLGYHAIYLYSQTHRILCVVYYQSQGPRRLLDLVSPSDYHGNLSLQAQGNIGQRGKKIGSRITTHLSTIIYLIVYHTLQHAICQQTAEAPWLKLEARWDTDRPAPYQASPPVQA